MISKSTGRFLNQAIKTVCCGILRSKGHKAALIPTLGFSFINKEILQKELSQPDKFEGIIFTSLRAVDAVSKSISVLSDALLLKWRNKKIYCVGESSSNLARTMLNFNTEGEESGNSEQLCKFILSCYPNGCCKPFLFPSSSKRQDTVPKFLGENGFKVIEVVSYETICNPSLKSHWEKLVNEQGLPDIIVFFSPSGVQFSHELIKESYSCTSLPKCIAIGPSTEKAMIDEALPPCKVAAKPNPEAVSEAIECIL